ncbi:glycosyltransferase family 2 protein [bacterium]|nr:glycosyltransferase family 2 protein [bacterium]
MKLVIQIPCYNEEESLLKTLEDLPKHIDGIDEIEILISDDGSTDKTIEVAKQFGVHHIVTSSHHRGLARTFTAAIQKALSVGADIIVNTDADNQYCAEDIQRLVKPILNRTADIVIGARPIDAIKMFSPFKKFLQKVGSYVIRLVSGTDIEDAPSGFRAFSREAALTINVFDNYSYTIETVLQSKTKGLHICSVPIRVNPCYRKSRLMTSMFQYIRKQVFTLTRMFIIYRPFRFFAIIGGLIFLSGLAVLTRFMFLYFSGHGNGHIQSLVIASILLIIGFQTGLFGIIADLLGINRKLIEDVQIRVKKIETKK